MKKEKDKKVKENNCECGCEEKDCTCSDDCHCNEAVFDTENDLNVAIIKNNKDLLLNENCCTCINIMLSNDGRILTSFLGCHNPYIVEQLEKAQKLYFKSLKKALKNHYFNNDSECDCGCGCEDECHCDDNCDCGCADGKDCTCGDDCNCNENKCNC